MLASQALGLIKSGELFRYPSELAGILHCESPVVEGQPMIVASDLQQVYTHRQVSNEGAQMHFDHQHPRLEQLQQKGLVIGPVSPDCGVGGKSTSSVSSILISSVVLRIPKTMVTAEAVSRGR